MTPKRGTLYDRNGSALAVSVEVPSVSLDAVELLRAVPPQHVPVVARDAANRIGQALGIDPARRRAKDPEEAPLLWLKHYATPDETEQVRQLSDPTRATPPFPASSWRARAAATTRAASSPARMLGFVSPDGDGKDGLELSLNAELEGHVEQLAGLRDRSGRLAVLRRHRGRAGARRARRHADDRPGHPVRRRARAAATRRARSRPRRLRRRRRPAHRRDPRARELPRVQPERLQRQRPGSAARSRAERALRARLDDEDVHRRRRARRRRHHADAAALLREGRDAARQRHDPRHAPVGVADDLADPRDLFEHLRRQDRPRHGRRQALRDVPSLRLRRDRRTCRSPASPPACSVRAVARGCRSRRRRPRSDRASA